ncbi:MAG: hypothetical protein Kow0099_09640 [Candidatus Abyssubacteria bacterium]
MMKRPHPILAITLVFMFISSAVAADTIVFKSGRVIEGEVVEETEDMVAVETETGTGFFSKEEIKSINQTKLGVARGSFVEVSGTVEVLPKGETEWKPAEKGMELDEGDQIRSGPDSKAIATFANQLIMAVEPQSAVNLEKLEKSRKAGVDIKINLDNGQIWNDVGTLRHKRSKFFVETPQAVTGVRGTAFAVRISPEQVTTVAVVKGEVDVRTRGMVMTPKKLGENSMTDVAAGRPPVEPTTISEEFLAQWKSYEGTFRMLRIGMLGGPLGLTPTQTFLAAAAIVVLIVVITIIVMVRRRRTA